MENPWKSFGESLPYDNFILEQDWEFIENHNKKHKETIFEIKIDILPEPFIGNLENPGLILLSLNPGCSDHKKVRKLHSSNQEFREAVRRNLIHDYTECPFYYLDNKFEKTKGFKWWNKNLKGLIDGVKNTAGIKDQDEARHKLGKKLAVIEYFPYASKRYKSLSDIIPSQEYSFKQAKNMLNKNVPIIIIRAKSKWLEILKPTYKANIFHINNWQQPSISLGNLSRDIEEGEFMILCEKLAC